MPEPIDVSVVIPSYNSEAFLKRSVLSALAQQGVAHEVIVLDDCSSDFSLDILRQIQEENPQAPLRIEPREATLGQSTARNRGMELARGRYIAFLDSDDAFCDLHVLAQWVAEADRHGLEMLIARFYNVSPEMVRSPARRLGLQPGEAHSVASAPELANVVSCWQILYSRAFLEENGVIFSPRLRQREDRLFVIEALLRTRRAGVSDLFAVDHFNVANSTMKQVNRDQLAQYVQHLSELNAAFAAARAEARSGQGFEAANAILYLQQLDEYWGRICQRLAGFERFRPLVTEYFAGLRAMVQELPALYRDAVLNINGREGFLREGRMDILRLALKRGDDDLLLQILARPRPPASLLAGLRGADASADEVITRSLSFRRDAAPAAAAAPVPLQQQIKRIILHTGLPKTGTSTLQQVMERNRFALLEAGVHYPVFGTNREFGVRRERTPGHASLFQKILEGAPGVAEALSAEVQEVSQIAGRPVETLILSAENIVSPRFWDRGADFAAMLAPFEGIGVEVACVLRHPADWLSSLYVEMCGNPWNGFTSTVDEFAASLDQLGLFDFDHIASVLQAPAAVSKLHLGCFEQIRAAGGIEPWFFGLAGIRAEAFAPVPRALTNESLTPQQAALMRLMKRLNGLTREDLANLFLMVSEDAEAAASKAPAAAMAAGLERFRSSHASEIAAYERAHGQAGRAREAAPVLDLEAALDRHLAALAAARRPAGRKRTERFLKRLDGAYGDSNRERIIRVRREARSLCVSVALEPGETAAGARLIHPQGEEPLALLRWENEALAQIDTARLEALWQAGLREVEIEIPTSLRNGRRPFLIVQLLADGTFWLVPPSFAGRLQGGGVESIWK